MADRSLKLLSKNRPDAGTLDIPIQRTIFGRGLSVRVFEIASRQHGRPARMSFFGQRPAFFGQPLCDLCFGIEIRASRGRSLRLTNEQTLKPRQSRGFLCLTKRRALY